MRTTTKQPSGCDEFSLDAVLLKHGSHGDHFDGEVCLIECSNRVAACVPEYREKFGKPKSFGDDHPSISRVVRAMSIGLNDLKWESDQARTDALKPFVTRVLGTATTSADEETRAWMATDWLVRVHTPAWLRLAGLVEEAQLLEGLARIVDSITADAAQPALDRARKASAAAWDAARDAARAAARAAASAAASAAARDAASAAASAAARDALATTSLTLRASAIELLGHMCDVGRGEDGQLAPQAVPHAR